ncbi:MAG: DUF4091 domain-containing protein [Clostridia bacterium]|nr:DUF4091 domain-containing protein [Clostridia bacterium]
MIQTKLVSSLEKAMLEDSLDRFEALGRISALKGERVSVQLLHTYRYEEGVGDVRRADCALTLEGDLASVATVRDVCNVGVERPVLPGIDEEEDYISLRPGLFPDVLRPLHAGNKVCCTADLLLSVWVELAIPRDLAAGEHTLTLRLDGGVCGVCEETLTVEVIDAVLPEESIYMTQWFHCDCLADYYGVEMWSERHWEIVETFAKKAVERGVNLLLTPTFTPPLDTAVGGERPTAQLVGVTKTGEDYSFDFTLLDRWVAMCDRIGVKYFEIAHFFTQWGAGHAPKVMATVDGVYQRIFGWDTDATGAEYSRFLRTFLQEFLAHMKKNGNDKRCFFHVSDEPHLEHLESYRAAKAVVEDLLEGYVIMDALSNYEFYKMGVTKTPIPANNKIAPFLEGQVPGLWTYYCCSQRKKVSNRLVAMPSWRNRSIGFQLYQYDIAGFLHWGYNFYYCWHSTDLINPFLQQDGDGWVPAGDAFSVYPAQDGTPWESLRLIVSHEALQDLRALRLCERYYGKEAVKALVDDEMGCKVTFDTCAKRAETILGLRRKVNAMIAKAVAEGRTEGFDGAR